MHPLKARILRYEKQYGFNLQARRGFNNMLRGGGLGDWLKRLFTKKQPATSTSSLLPSGLRQTTMNIRGKRKERDEPTNAGNPIEKRTHLSKSPTTQPIDSFDTKPIDLSGTERSSNLSSKQHIIDLTESNSWASKATDSSSSSTSSLVTRRPKYVPNPEEWRNAYCKYKVMISRANPHALVDSRYVEEIQQKGERVNFVFDCQDNSGGGDCFLYAWLIADQLYGNNFLNSWWTGCSFEGIDTSTTKGKMFCLRRMLATQLENFRSKSTDISALNIEKIKSPTTWLRSQEIELIAKYFNMHFLMYCEQSKSWQEFGRFQQGVGETQSPTYYIYNTGGVRDGYTGNHFMTLVPIPETRGNFSC